MNKLFIFLAGWIGGIVMSTTSGLIEKLLVTLLTIIIFSLLLALGNRNS